MSVFKLFSGKSQHPLADPRELKRICADLAVREPQGVVEEAVGWFESLVEYNDIKLNVRLESLLKLDEAATIQARRLTRDYLKRSTGVDAQQGDEASLWESGHRYWGKLVSAYADCLERYAESGQDTQTQKAAQVWLPKTYLRLLHAHAAHNKWRQFRYSLAGPEFWGTIGEIYLLMARNKLATQSMELYPGYPASTAEAEYLKILLLHASSPDKLPPVDIELAERLIAHFLPWFIFTHELRRDNMYWVDTALPLPPARMAKLPAPSDSLRFFSGGAAVAAIAELSEQIKAQHRVPPHIVLGGTYEPDLVLRVLDHLAMYWSPSPPVRSHARRRVNSPLSVAHGLLSAQRHVLGEPRVADELDQWESDDVSMGGMSARISAGRQDWIGIGALVAVQPAGGSNWLVGVVRRYVRINARKGAVGIQTLSKAPRAVLADAGGLQTEAILLDLPVVGEYARMVLPAAALEEKVALLFRVDGVNARLHPREILATGPDYVVANFFVQSYS